MTCSYCGAEFDPRPNEKYCSDACRSGHARDYTLARSRASAKSKRKDFCDFCGKILQKFKTRFCSAACRKTNYNVTTGRCVTRGPITKTCVICGDEFTTTKSRTLTCSKACSDANTRRRANARRVYKDITVDPDISLRKLACRDGDQCQICGLFVDWHDIDEKNGRLICGNMYPSIDHIRPVSRGGLHAWDNVQLAHRKCNSYKNDRYEE